MASASLGSTAGSSTGKGATFGADATQQTLGVTGAFEALEEEDETMVGTRRRRRKPGERWDGRVGGLSLREYRELKWGTEAGFAMTERRGPSYSMRRPCLVKAKSGPDVLLDIDVYKSFYSTQPSPPSFTHGRQAITIERDRSQGPAQYALKGIFGSSSHPTIPKDLGRQFGRERLLVNDESMPAPGDYSVAGFEKSGRYKKSPDYSIQGREAWKDPPVAPGPSCGEYQFDEVFRIGKHHPTRWTVQGKTEASEPPTGAAATRLRKRIDQMKRTHKFEKELDFKQISPILLALDSPGLMEIFQKLKDNASLVRDPNIFLVSAAMHRLGNGGGHGSRKPVQPGPDHYSPPGAGGLIEATKDSSPKWRFGSEHRGLT